MIRRITLKNGEIKELDYYTQCDSYYRKTEIVKVEKQVKNLTLEECNKLGVNIDTYGNYYELNGQVLGFDDYIDITQLVKMNNYCGKNYTNVYGDEMEKLEG